MKGAGRSVLTGTEGVAAALHPPDLLAHEKDVGKAEAHQHQRRQQRHIRPHRQDRLVQGQEVLEPLQRQPLHRPRQLAEQQLRFWSLDLLSTGLSRKASVYHGSGPTMVCVAGLVRKFRRWRNMSKLQGAAGCRPLRQLGWPPLQAPTTWACTTDDTRVTFPLHRLGWDVLANTLSRTDCWGQ